jgi:hypothetical protein
VLQKTDAEKWWPLMKGFGIKLDRLPIQGVQGARRALRGQKRESAGI